MSFVTETLRDARRRASLTQAALADRVGTSQATISAYESGRKDPTAGTLERLLAAAGLRLSVEPAQGAIVMPSRAELRRRGRVLSQVLDLADTLPARHDRELHYPRLKDLS